MGLLDSLFNSDSYGGQGGGLLDFLRQSQMQQDQYQPSAGFQPTASFADRFNASQPSATFADRFNASAPSATFADRFNEIPGAPQPFAGGGRSFDNAQFDPQGFAPNQAQPIAVGNNYQMPRLGSADQFSPQQALTPPNAQPAQGQLPQGQRVPQQAPQEPQQELPPAFGGTSYLERLNAGGGLIGSLLGDTTQQKNLTAQYNAIRQALISNGETPQAAASKAMIAAMNPEAAKTIIPELFTTREKFQKTGQNPATGADQYGFVNERDQTVNGKAVNAQPTENTVGDPNLTGDAYLQSLPAGMQSQIKAIVEGRMQPPSGFALKSPQIQFLMKAAAQYEPGFDLTKWSSRAGTAKDFASGVAARNVTSLNTVIGQLGDLKETAEALNNSSIPLWNTAGNAINSATGSPEVNNFNLARNAVADELAKVFKGSGVSDHEIAQWKETLNASQSPAQLKGAVKTAINLMDSRLHALNDQRDRGMSTQTEPRSLLNSKSKEGLTKIEEWANGGSGTKSSGGVDRSAIEAEMKRRGLLK